LRSLGFKLFPRCAWHDQAIWYDLTNESWQAVRITHHGWTIEQPPTLFRRFPHQLPQIDPEKGTKGKNIDQIFSIIRLKNKDDEFLFKVILVAKYVPGIVHPIDVLYGPQGSSKSSIDRIKKSLIDPSRLQSSALPKNKEELIQMVSIIGNHLSITFQN